jgi:hypothetical protein
MHVEIQFGIPRSIKNNYHTIEYIISKDTNNLPTIVAKHKGTMVPSWEDYVNDLLFFLEDNYESEWLIDRRNDGNMGGVFMNSDGNFFVMDIWRESVAYHISFPIPSEQNKGYLGNRGLPVIPKSAAEKLLWEYATYLGKVE